MPQQFDLEGFGDPEPTTPTDRLFFAILPDPATAARICVFTQQLSQEHGLRGRPLLADRLHITLHHLGDYAGLPDGLIDRACQAAAQIQAASFDVTFERVLSFGRKSRNRPIVLLGNQAELGGLADLAAFQKVLYAQMCRAGLQGEKQIARQNANFTPHTTLLYDMTDVPEQAIEPISWRATEFVLVHSLLGKTKHVHLARWPFG